MRTLELLEIEVGERDQIPLGYRKIYFRPLEPSEFVDSKEIEMVQLDGAAPSSERPQRPISKLLI